MLQLPTSILLLLHDPPSVRPESQLPPMLATPRRARSRGLARLARIGTRPWRSGGEPLAPEAGG